MPTADQWRQWADTALSSDDPTQVAEATRRLYEAARRDAGPAVRSKWDVSDDALQDLVHALLATRWDAILEAENPKALFVVALRRRAIDRFKKVDRRERPLDARPSDAAAPSLEAQRAAQQELDQVRAFLEATLSPRDLRVFCARVMLGEPSRAVAEAEGLTRANVDQIVSRTRRRLKEHFGGAA